MLCMAGKIIRKDLDAEEKCPECNWLTPVMFSSDGENSQTGEACQSEWLCGNCLCEKLVEEGYAVDDTDRIVEALEGIAQEIKKSRGLGCQ